MLVQYLHFLIMYVTNFFSFFWFLDHILNRVMDGLFVSNQSLDVNHDFGRNSSSYSSSRS